MHPLNIFFFFFKYFHAVRFIFIFLKYINFISFISFFYSSPFFIFIFLREGLKISYSLQPQQVKVRLRLTDIKILYKVLKAAQGWHKKYLLNRELIAKVNNDLSKAVYLNWCISQSEWSCSIYPSVVCLKVVSECQ